MLIIARTWPQLMKKKLKKGQRPTGKPQTKLEPVRLLTICCTTHTDCFHHAINSAIALDHTAAIPVWYLPVSHRSCGNYVWCTHAMPLQSNKLAS